MNAELREYLIKVEVQRWEAFVLQQGEERESETPEADEKGTIRFIKQTLKQPAIKRGLHLFGKIVESRRAHLPSDITNGESEPSTDDFWLDETERQELKRNVGDREIVMDLKEKDDKSVGIVLPRYYANEDELAIKLFVRPGFLNAFIDLASKEGDSIGVLLGIVGIAQVWNSNTEGLEVTMMKLTNSRSEKKVLANRRERITTRCRRTLDRFLPSLPLRSVAVKRG